MSDCQIRAATADDLAAAFAIYAEYEFGAGAARDDVGVPSYLSHLLATGRVVVAARAGGIVGFAGSATRGNVSFLTDLFVRPEAQSGAIGKALLRAVFPVEGVRCTCSTSDPRALSLYIRAGMRPAWPHYLVHRAGRSGEAPPARAAMPVIDVLEADMGDPQLVAWEAMIGGRPRRDDLAFWAREQDARALWLLRDGAPIGYAIVRLRGGTVTHPGAITLGPIGVHDADDAAPCLQAALAWARGLGAEFCLTIPGPHTALASLLEAGWRIADSYTFVASDRGAFADPQRYVSSGPDLF